MEFIKKHKIFILIIVILVALLIINFCSQTKALKVSEKAFEILENIDFSNSENIEKLGFEWHEDCYYLKTEGDEYICRITVESKVKTEGGLDKHGDILYNAKEFRPRIFSWDRLSGNDYNVTKIYTFYKDGMEISIIEHNTKNGKFSTVKFIENNFKSY